MFPRPPGAGKARPPASAPIPGRRALPAALALCLLAAGTGAGEALEQRLVMLQGPDLEALETAVATQGGEVTHRLPIIGALGARLNRDQLDALRAAGAPLTRVIDDLAWRPEPEKPGDCALAGALELVWTGSAASWVLFNSGAQPLALSRIELKWPASLGALKSARLGREPLEIHNPDAAQVWTWSGAAPPELPARGRRSLHMEFTRPPAAAVQKAFALGASSAGDCATRLAPSYAQPDRDSYYPTVSGAAALHRHGVTGRGVTVAVLDSGLWEQHAELARDTSGRPRVIARYDAIRGEAVAEAFDETGHGTHMSSVIARSGKTTREGAPRPSYRGIAPDVKLVAIKAIGASGEAGFLDIVRGVQWAVEQREALNIRVLNLSFAARPRWAYWQDPVNQALMRAWAAGIFISAAAGNEGPEPMSVGSPGNLPYLMTVGAASDSWTEADPDDDYIPDFSSRGPTPMGHIKPDVVAPGGHISGLMGPAAALARARPQYRLASGEFAMTGTSPAAALVSGLAALMLQLEPELSNDAIKCRFKTSAQPAIELDGRLAYSPFVQGDGRVSLRRALTLGSNSCAQQGLDLAADLAGVEHFQGPARFREDGAPSLPGAHRLVSEAPAEGPSATRRWGAAAHLQRLSAPPQNSPIDWLSIHASEQRRLRAMAGGAPRKSAR